MSTAYNPAVSRGLDAHGQVSQTTSHAPHGNSHHPAGTPHTPAPHGHEHRAAPHAHHASGGAKSHAHHAPHPKAEKKPAGWAWLVALALMAGGGFLGVQLAGNGLPHVTGAELSHVIELASKGVPPAPRKDGIAIRTLSSSGVTVVTAENVPPKICVSAGWDLVKDGTLTVNGITPMRVSAAKLSELCYSGSSATITWMPDDKDGQ